MEKHTLTVFKSSAIHNLRIQEVSCKGEGIMLPQNIMEAINLKNYQEVIITHIGAGSWKNRIHTFVISGAENSPVVVRGSLSKFLNKGDLTCLIAEAYNDSMMMKRYHDNLLPILDYGFDPQKNYDNTAGTLDLQYNDTTVKNVEIGGVDFKRAIEERRDINRKFLKSLALNLKVNKTHPDCLQGSAELPESVLKACGIERYKSVSVYNKDAGGSADTYAVPMPEGVVMTTGAMASFASIGQTVAVAAYVIDRETPDITIIETDGNKVVGCERGEDMKIISKPTKTIAVTMCGSNHGSSHQSYTMLVSRNTTVGKDETKKEMKKAV